MIMFNPFVRFEYRFIDAFMGTKEIYLVSQTFKRGYDLFGDQNKDCIILTHYADPGLAVIHKRAVEHDRFAAILNLSKTAHRQKLEGMLQIDSKYIVFSSLVSDPDNVKERLNKRFIDNIRRYVLKNTNWRIGGDDELATKYEVTFGELYVTLKYSAKQPLRIKFEEIEKS